MPRVNCKHFLGCYVRRDPDTDECIGWMGDCDVFGNEQELGYDCGKRCCDCYTPKAKTRKRKCESCKHSRWFAEYAMTVCEKHGKTNMLEVCEDYEVKGGEE